MRHALFVSLALLVVLGAGSAISQEASAPSSLPGGAAALTETHGDWTVSCRMEQGAKLCALSQALADSGTGQLMLSVELAAPALDRIEGMLLLPFGLRLADGASLKVDAEPLGLTQSFLTCIASGCLVPVTFGAVEVSALRDGEELTISAISANGGEIVDMPVSLAGFSMASNRSVELSN